VTGDLARLSEMRSVAGQGDAGHHPIFEAELDERVIAIPGSIDTFGDEADLVRVIGRIAHIETVIGAHAQRQRGHALRLACTHNRYVLHDAGIRVEYRELPFFLNEAELRLPLRFVVSVTEALDVRGFFLGTFAA
jgi:hypothetical protein